MVNFQPLIDVMNTFTTGLQQFNQDSSSRPVIDAANEDAKVKAAEAQKALDDKDASIAADAALLAPSVSAIATVAAALAAELATPPAV